MNKVHSYSTAITWTGNTGTGTKEYKGYERSHTISIPHKPDLYGSSDAAFRGDPSKHTPEDLLVASLSACHMLWYLHECSVAGVIVLKYTDNASGTMIETEDGGGRFIEVTLHPEVMVADVSMIERAQLLHATAHKKCFIANSCNFPVHHQPVCKAQ